MAPIKVYYAITSPAARSTLLTVAALGLDAEEIQVNLMTGDHVKPEFLKKNPLHTVPVLEDGDFTIFESHAINAYLVSKYGKNDSLYPKDLQKRAVVDQRLHFDNGVLYAGETAAILPIFTGKSKSIDSQAIDNLKEAYQSLEALLDGHKYAAGNDVTIADFSLASTLSTCATFAPVDEKAFPKITAWLKRMEALPYYKPINDEGVQQFVGILKHLN